VIVATFNGSKKLNVHFLYL